MATKRKRKTSRTRGAYAPAANKVEQPTTGRYFVSNVVDANGDATHPHWRGLTGDVLGNVAERMYANAGAAENSIDAARSDLDRAARRKGGVKERTVVKGQEG